MCIATFISVQNIYTRTENFTTKQPIQAVNYSVELI